MNPYSISMIHTQLTTYIKVNTCLEGSVRIF